MQVITKYEGCEYITANKLYDVFYNDDGHPSIIDDENEVRCIYIDECSHLDGERWEVITCK